MRTTNYQTHGNESCLSVESIDIELEREIPKRSRGLTGMARALTGSTPAKVPYLLGFYPPTYRWSVDYTNINFSKLTPKCIVNVSHRDRPRTDYSGNPRRLQPNGGRNPWKALGKSRRLGANPAAITRVIPPGTFPAAYENGTLLPVAPQKFFEKQPVFMEAHNG